METGAVMVYRYLTSLVGRGREWMRLIIREAVAEGLPLPRGPVDLLRHVVASRFVTPMSHMIIPIIPIINLLTQPP